MTNVILYDDAVFVWKVVGIFLGAIQNHTKFFLYEFVWFTFFCMNLYDGSGPIARILYHTYYRGFGLLAHMPTWLFAHMPTWLFAHYLHTNSYKIDSYKFVQKVFAWWWGDFVLRCTMWKIHFIQNHTNLWICMMAVWLCITVHHVEGKP